MSTKETLEKAYGNVPKEVPYDLDWFSWVPSWRGIRYYYFKIVRNITR